MLEEKLAKKIVFHVSNFSVSPEFGEKKLCWERFGHDSLYTREDITTTGNSYTRRSEENRTVTIQTTESMKGWPLSPHQKKKFLSSNH